MYLVGLRCNEEKRLYLHYSSMLALKLNAKKKRLRIDAIPSRNLPKSSVDNVAKQVSRSAERRHKNRTERYERRSLRRFVVSVRLI